MIHVIFSKTCFEIQLPVLLPRDFTLCSFLLPQLLPPLFPLFCCCPISFQLLVIFFPLATVAAADSKHGYTHYNFFPLQSYHLTYSPLSPLQFSTILQQLWSI